MKEKLISLREQYKTNPGWCWLLATIFLFPILPEYVSPFILFIGFIVFKVQWSHEGKKAKVGTLGKLMLAFMGYSLVSTLWSTTKFSTLATAGLWWGMFLIQVMINNLVRTRKKIDRILAAMSLSGAINGFVAILQIAPRAKAPGHCAAQMSQPFPLVSQMASICMRFPPCGYTGAESTASTGMSCASVSSRGSSWKA